MWRSRVPVVFALWSLFVWVTRIRNVVRDDGGTVGLLAPAAVCGLAAWALVDRRRGVAALATATVAMWAVRLPMVLAHDHGVAFKVVHAGLAAVSLGLAALALREVRSAATRLASLR